MSSNGLILDFIGITELGKRYKINGYRNLLFNTRPDRDDGHDGVGLYISDKFTYSRHEDLSIFIPHVFVNFGCNLLIYMKLKVWLKKLVQQTIEELAILIEHIINQSFVTSHVADI